MDIETGNNRALPRITLITAVMFTVSSVALSIASSFYLERTLSLLLLGLFLGLGLITSAFALITGGRNKIFDPLYERTDAVGTRYVLFSLTYMMLPVLFQILGYMFIEDFDKLITEYTTRYSLIITVLVLYVIACPMLLLTTRKIPKMVIKQRKMGLGVFAACIAIVCALCLIGTLIGTPIHLILTTPFEHGDSFDISDVMTDTNLFERVLVVGILAPVFEEIMCRKILIDHTISHGQTFSILMSGLIFGLFHGNFQQFFYAALIGMLFALIYIRTGRIRYTIFLHMIVNLSSSVITASLALKLMPYADELSTLTNVPDDVLAAYFVLIMWFLFLGALALTGIILIIVFFRRLMPYRAPDEPGPGKVLGYMFSSPMFWAFVIMNLGQFASEYLPDIFYTLM